MQEGEYTRQTATEEMATYLWENYLEYTEAVEMFVMGVGEACKGIWHLLETQGKSCLFLVYII